MDEERLMKKQAVRSPAAGRTAVRRVATDAHYVASTHWDREWYEPFQQYRFRLVQVLDELIDLMERDPEYRSWQMDGQSILIEDYLEARPERRERLQALFDAGRLLAGPWYVMPDEFLPCGESLVRNLALGHEVASTVTTPMSVGFVCDIFGHNSQFPQILRGFGIRDAVVWRGTEFGDTPGLFRWQAADGSEVLAYNFEPRGYGHYWQDVREPSRKPDGKVDLDKAIAGVRKLVASEAEHMPGNVVMLFDGLDHTHAEPMTSAILAGARRAGVHVQHSSLPEFFKALRAQKLKLVAQKGELRFCPKLWRDVIPGVDSSRMYIKQANAACEHRLLQWAEPFGAFATLLGEEYRPAFLKLAWKYLITNHPHDSIGGCSIDQVHKDMMYRFDQARLIADRSTHLSLRAVADRTPLPKLEGDEDYAVTVFNPTSEDINGVVDVPLFFKKDTPYRFQEWFGYEPIVGFRLYDTADKELPYQRLDVTKLVPIAWWDPVQGFIGDKREQVRIAAKLNIPARGWTTFVCKPTKERTRSQGSQVVDDHTMENEFLRVRVNCNGTIDLTDRVADRKYRNLLTIEERADIGDGWYHGTAVNDEINSSIASSADVALVTDGPVLTTFRIRVVMNVPERFQVDPQVMRRSERLVPLEITSWLTLKAGSRHLDVRTEVNNTVREHRVRMLFPTGLSTKMYFADSPYDVVERPIAIRPDSHLLFEQELETKPQYSFTAVNDGEHGLAVVTTGQPESAVRDLPDRPIALTLFRGFPRTVGQEGEMGGQMLGPTRHRFWLYPHQGPLPAADLLRLGQRLAAGLECIYTDKPRLKLLRGKPTLPATGSWLTLSAGRSGAGPLVVTACKQSGDGTALIVRAFNPTDEAAEQKLECLWPLKSASYADLLEQPTEALETKGQAVTIAAKARQIVTMRLELGKKR
jgi:alpha-mannosidase/mannosylglycerate hydrolase